MFRCLKVNIGGMRAYRHVNDPVHQTDDGCVAGEILEPIDLLFFYVT